jgi:Flp pilus assembly pilin Flp
MNRIVIALRRFVSDEQGQDLLEYGLLAVLVAIAAMAAVTTVGDTLNRLWWEQIADGIADLL